MPLIQNFDVGGEKGLDPPLIWLLVDCGGFGCELGIHRTGGLDKILWFFFWFCRGPSTLNSDLVDVKNWRQHPARAGTGWRSSNDLWIYWVLTLFWMLSVHCLVREFLFPLSLLRNLRPGPAMRILGHIAGKSADPETLVQISLTPKPRLTYKACCKLQAVLGFANRVAFGAEWRGGPGCVLKEALARSVIGGRIT